MGGINYLNKTAIETPGGLAATAGSITLQTFSLLWGIAASTMMGRRRRRASDPVDSFGPNQDRAFIPDVLFKVIDDLDEPACLPLALCHVASIPETLQTPDHRAILSLLSPLPALPVAWPDITKPSAKYQYAAFMGQWAMRTGVPEQCRLVFPSCGMSGADVINLVTSWKAPCDGEAMDNNIRKMQS